jgi:hypothetical protein
VDRPPARYSKQYPTATHLHPTALGNAPNSGRRSVDPPSQQAPNTPGQNGRKGACSDSSSSAWVWQKHATRLEADATRAGQAHMLSRLPRPFATDLGQSSTKLPMITVAALRLPAAIQRLSHARTRTRSETLPRPVQRILPAQPPFPLQCYSRRGAHHRSANSGGHGSIPMRDGRLSVYLITPRGCRAGPSKRGINENRCRPARDREPVTAPWWSTGP